MTVNPLVAGRLDQSRSAWAGVWIAEDIELIAEGVRSRSWVDGSLGVVGAGLDGLALVSDPVGALLQYGISWLIEHVRPLSEALDWLAGDPGEIAGRAQTWRNVASSLRDEADALVRAARFDVSQWQGAASEAYRGWVDQRDRSLSALAGACDAMALITEGAGLLIGTVRVMVRDAVAVVVSRLVVYAGELIASFGMATPVVVEQVSTLCASWAARIVRWLKDLLGSIRNLMRESDKLAKLIELLRKRPFGRTGDGNGPRTPHQPTKKIGSPKDFRPEEIRGLTPDQVKAQIPDDWQARPSKSGDGIVYADPHNRGRQIRLMPGYPPGSRPDPLTWGPYAEVCQNGVTKKVPLLGNPTL